MKNWKYKVQSSPQEIIKKIDSVLRSSGGFIFKVANDSRSFNIRKPVKYPDQILHRNRLIVNGKISTTKKESDLEISFAQDFYMKMTVLSIIILGAALLVFIPKISSGLFMYLLGGIVVVIGIALWVALQKKLERDSQKYKALISEILGTS